MRVRVESRHRKRWWLPRWMPGNVYAIVLNDEISLQEGLDLANTALACGAFAVTVEADDEIHAFGAVRVHGMNQ